MAKKTHKLWWWEGEEAQMVLVSFTHSEWRRELRLRLRYKTRWGSWTTDTIAISSPAERDDFCRKLEAFLDNPDLWEEHIFYGSHRCWGGHWQKRPGDELIRVALKDKKGLVALPERELHGLLIVLRAYQ